MTLRDGMIFGLCNPLLDFTANVDVKLLEKYNLKENVAILGDDSHLEIYTDLEETHHVEFSLGGATQNTMRCISWILNKPNIASFTGCVGADKYAKIMEEKARAVGVNTAYQVKNDKRTGTCAVLITGKNRTLVAHLHAANCFTVDHFDEPQYWSLVEKAQVNYVSGFFFTVCPEAIMQVAEHSLKNDKVFCVNLSAPFITEFFKDRFMAAYPYVNMVFGNNDEAMAFSKNVLGVESTDCQSIAKAMSNLPTKSNKKRIVVITQGAEPVILAVGDDIKLFSVPKLEDDKIVDTNGAGDAFVGGFLAQYLKGESLDKCIDCGIWISREVVQRYGCTFPDTMDYK